MDLFVVGHEFRTRLYVPVDLTSWSNLRPDHLLLIPSPLLVFYCSNLFLNKSYNRFLLNIARFECGSCTGLQLPWSLLSDSIALSRETRALHPMFSILLLSETRCFLSVRSLHLKIPISTSRLIWRPAPKAWEKMRFFSWPLVSTLPGT